MREIRIYCEGDPSLKAGFKALFTKALPSGDRGARIKFIAGGGTEQTLNDFRKAIVTHRDSLVLALVDADDKGRANEQNCFYMVQIMESWFLADRQALKSYFGNCLREGALPGSASNVEAIPKSDVERGLAHATKDCKKGAYGNRTKVDHGRELLKRIDPDLVRRGSPEFARMLTALG